MAALPNTSKLPPLPKVPAKVKPTNPFSAEAIAWNKENTEFNNAWGKLTEAQRNEWAKTLGVTIPPPPVFPQLMKNGKINPTFAKNQANFSKALFERFVPFTDALRDHQKKLGEKVAANMKAMQDKIAAQMKTATPTVAATPVPAAVPVTPGPTAAVAKATNAAVKAVAATPSPMNAAQQAKLKMIADTLGKVATNLGAMAAGPVLPAGTSGIAVPNPPPPAKGGARRRKSTRKMAKKQKKMTRRR